MPSNDFDIAGNGDEAVDEVLARQQLELEEAMEASASVPAAMAAIRASMAATNMAISVLKQVASVGLISSEAVEMAVLASRDAGRKPHQPCEVVDWLGEAVKFAEAVAQSPFDEPSEDDEQE